MSDIQAEIITLEKKLKEKISNEESIKIEKKLCELQLKLIQQNEIKPRILNIETKETKKGPPIDNEFGL